MGEFFISRSTDGDDTGNPGIYPRRQPSDSATLARRIPAFKENRAGDPRFYRLYTSNHILPTVAQPIPSYMPRVHRSWKDRWHPERKSALSLLHSLLLEPLGPHSAASRRPRFNRRNNGPGYRRITEIAVICVDDGPRGIHPVRQSNGLGCRAHKAVIVLGTLLVIRVSGGSPDASGDLSNGPSGPSYRDEARA
mgnify:CR=1 FL=1